MKAVAAGGEDAAEQIARLLREGRAAEVTDEMLGALGPNDQARLFELYESGATGMDMPMDEVSRMARAREMGHEPGVYASTLEDKRAFEPAGQFMGYTGTSGASLTDSPEAASRYLDRYGNFDYKNKPFDKNVMPLTANIGKAEIRDKPYPTKLRLGAPLPENYVAPHRLKGYDTAIFEDAVSRRGPVKHSDAKNAIRSREYVISDPANIRSRHARFDPRLSKNADLLASRAAPGGMGDYSTQEARAAPRGVMAIPMRPSSPSMPSGAGPSLSDALGRVAQAFGTAGRAGIEGMATALSGVDEQGRSVGSILPFAKDERTGEVGLASPRILDLWNTAGGVVPARGVTLGAGPVMRGADSALDMSQEARMARAREMGFNFNKPGYHGTPRLDALDEVGAFNSGDWGRQSSVGVWFSDTPETAGEYVTKGWPRDEAPGMVKAVTRGKLLNLDPDVMGPDEYKALGKVYDALKGDLWFENADEFVEAVQNGNIWNISGDGDLRIQNDILNEIQALGYERVKIPDSVGGMWNTSEVVFDPKNIRSVHAAFDPAKRDSADLLASRAAPGSLGIGGDRRLTYRDLEDWL